MCHGNFAYPILASSTGYMFYSSYSQGQDHFDFTLFYEEYAKVYPNKPLPSKLFLQWFIGFWEGDGSLSASSNNRFAFVITQSTVDLALLEYIQKMLGFGSVILQSQVNYTHRFVVQDKVNLHLLCLLLNGNLVFPVRQEKFLAFLSVFNVFTSSGSLILPRIIPLLTTVLPTLADAWLSGFTNAEGCFSVSLLSNSNAFRFRFLLSQKWDMNKPILEHIVFMLGVGAVTPHTIPLNWEVRINGLLNCKAIFSYFSAYPLKFSKYQSYLLWVQMHDRLAAKDHLNPAMRADLKLLASQINLKRKKS